MRIRKKEQVAGLVGAVTNSKSDSTTDTYSCDYINKFDGTILYENSSGSNGTITLNENASNFSKLIVEYKSNYSGRTLSVTVFEPNGKTINTSFIDGRIDSSTSYYRSSSAYIEGTSISRNKGQTYDTYNKSPGITESSDTTAYPFITRVVGYR